MDSRISAIISKALDGLTLRAQATAQNIANANSPNYRPMRVSFEDELKAAAQHSDDAVRSLRFRMAQAIETDGDPKQRIDLELASASETALRYGALVDVLSRELQLQRTMIRGGQ
jgi:flagellar basal-body rod protein FlgB